MVPHVAIARLRHEQELRWNIDAATMAELKTKPTTVSVTDFMVEESVEYLRARK